MPSYNYPADFEGTFWTIVDGDYYVSTIGNDISGDGSPQNPFLTVRRAFELAETNEKIVIGPDEYLTVDGTLSTGATGSVAPCRLATTTNISLLIGGMFTIDGVLTEEGDRVLVWQQSAPTENGIYVAQSGAWLRAEDFNNPDNMIHWMLVAVREGDTYAGSIFQHTTAQYIVVGATNIAFEAAAPSHWGELQGDINDQTDLTSRINDDITVAVDNLLEGVPTEGDTLNKLYTLIQNLVTVDASATTIANRDAQQGDLQDQQNIYVEDASADPTINSGWAIYKYIAATTSFVKIAEQESIDMQLISAGSGLSENAGAIGLGGNLTQNTSINNAGFDLTVDGPGNLFLSGDAGTSIASTANVDIQGLTYPGADGTAGQVLTTDGVGNLSFQNAAVTSYQQLNLIGNTLQLDNGGSVDLSPYLDDTDAQILNFNAGTQELSISGGNNVDLSSLVADLSGYAPLVSPSFTGTPIAPTAAPGTATTQIATTEFVTTAGNLKADLDSPVFTGTPSLPTGTTAITQASGNDSTALATTAFVTAAVTASVGTDLQQLNLIGNTLQLDNGGSVDLSPYLDDTDAQILNFNAGTQELSISGGNNVDLSSLVADLSGYAPLVSPGFTGTPIAPTAAPGTATTQIATTGFVTTAGNLKADLDSPVFTGTPSLPTGTTAITQASGNDSTALATTAFVTAAVAASVGTDLQQLNLIGNTLQLDNGGSVDLSPYLDDTDAQILNFNAGTQELSISGGNNVNLSSLVIDVSGYAPLVSPGFTGIPTAPTAAPGTDSTQMATTAFVAAAITASAGTDHQQINLVGNTLQLDNGGSVDLSPYLDDTDAQTLNFNAGTQELSISGGNNVDLSSLAADLSGYAPLVSPGFTGVPKAPTAASGTNSTQIATTAFVAAAITASAGTDLQQLNLVGNTLQLDNGGSVDLSPYLDDTDAQILNFNAGTQELSISGGNNVDLSSLAADLSGYAPLVSPGFTGIPTAPTAAPGTDSTQMATTGFVTTAGNLKADLDSPVFTGTPSLPTGTTAITQASGNDSTALATTAFVTAAVAASAGTDLQQLNLVGNTLQLDNGGSVDLSPYLDDTDAQILNFDAGTQELSISGGNNVDLSSLVADLSGYAPLVSPGFTGIPTAPTAAPGTDSTQMATTAFVAAAITASAGTDLQQLNLVGNTLQLDNGGSVDLSPYLDDTDAQTLNFDAGTQQLSISGGNNVDLSSLAGGGNLTNLEDNGVNVKNAPSGTGYFKWDNVKIDGGGITAPGNIMANDFIATSDMRLKTDAVPIGNYKDIYHLNAYKHGWEHNDEMTFGLMAQEVEQYFPELVKTDTNGHKAMSYMKLVPVMLEAIKDLKEQLNSLKS